MVEESIWPALLISGAFGLLGRAAAVFKPPMRNTRLPFLIREALVGITAGIVGGGLAEHFGVRHTAAIGVMILAGYGGIGTIVFLSNAAKKRFV